MSSANPPLRVLDGPKMAAANTRRKRRSPSVRLKRRSPSALLKRRTSGLWPPFSVGRTLGSADLWNPYDVFFDVSSNSVATNVRRSTARYPPSTAVASRRTVS
ncbi:unnamed protein product [Macrosiphum euphorbiae]|uniref:Uncharacterized protein n=1 Tax=Macrosiphum euphorbiae TaxID=13131 RepID=A0AAV0W6Y9_9HEMI|nr:unnamed protein product [Macrosiphum euphorbiae]